MNVEGTADSMADWKSAAHFSCCIMKVDASRGDVNSSKKPKWSFSCKNCMKYLQRWRCRWQSGSCRQGGQPGILRWHCNHHVPHERWSWRRSSHPWRNMCTCTLGGGRGRRVQWGRPGGVHMLEQRRVLRKLLRKERRRGEPENKIKSIN